MGVRRIDSTLCNGCGTCVDICPMDVLRLDTSHKKAYIKYLRDCESCALCEQDCPKGAIEVVATYERRMPFAW